MERLGWRSSWAGQHAIHAQPARFAPRLRAIILAFTMDRLLLRRRAQGGNRVCVEMVGLERLHLTQRVDDPPAELEKARPTSLPTPLLERPRRHPPTGG